MFDAQAIRKDFPNLNIKVKNKPLVYFDNGATTLKCQPVIDAVSNHYTCGTSNIHRAVHTLSQQATAAYESSRQKTQEFLNAANTEEIIFTSGTTDSINCVMQSYGRKFIGQGDEILITEMEHHSNIVPWQMLCEEKECTLKIIPFNDKGELHIDKLDELITDRTKLISVVHISNSLGTINPVQTIINAAHAKNIPVLVDAAQSVSHCPIDVQKLDCDFLCFSAHKLFGPTGVGVLYGKRALLEKMNPYRGGGDMIETVSFDKTTYAELPSKFEAGTPNIAGVIGFGAAIDYLGRIDLNAAARHRKKLLESLTDKLTAIEGVKIFGNADQKTSILSFNIDGVHAHDLGTLVDEEGVAIRTGHHCTMPVMQHFGVAATSRASLTFYNTEEEINTFIKAIQQAIKILR